MRVLLATLLGLILLAGGARAEHCTGSAEPDPTSVDHCRTVNTLVCVYADHDLDEDEPGCAGSESLFVMLYADSNGIPGYQRGDECQDDTCHGQIESDTILF